MLNGKTIPSTDSFECLGVIIDKRLLWDNHIEKICKNVGAGIAVMKRIKPFVPIETMRVIAKLAQSEYTFKMNINSLDT